MMRRPVTDRPWTAMLSACSLCALALVAAPALAGTVYVPLTIDGEAGGIGLRTDVWIANTTGRAIEFSSFFVPALTDGTMRPDVEPGKIQIAAGGTLRFEGIAPVNAIGITELDLPEGVVATARLITIHPQFGELLGSEMPILSSDNLVPANTKAHVQGWERSPGRIVTNFGAVNLSQSKAQCEVSVFRGNGRQISGTAIISVAPLSSTYFPQALGILQQGEVPTARAEVTCDQIFYPFALVTNMEDGEAVFHGPSARGEDGLATQGPSECPQNALCFSRAGTFFAPTVRDDYRRESFTIPAGSYSSLHFRVEVVHGGWTEPTSGLHLMFWLAKAGRHFNLYGFAGFKGPARNTILFRHGIGIPAGDKPKFESNFVAVPGQTYIFDYVYNPAERFLDMKILDTNGKVLYRATDRPNVNSIVISPGEDITADFSNRLGANPSEPPSYGWQYRNLEFELYQ